MKEDKENKMNDLFRALACKKRVDIINLLKKSYLTINEIAEKLQIDKSVASRHISVLRELNIVDYEKKGTNLYCYIKNKDIFSIINLAKNFIHNNF